MDLSYSLNNTLSISSIVVEAENKNVMIPSLESVEVLVLKVLNAFKKPLAKQDCKEALLLFETTLHKKYHLSANKHGADLMRFFQIFIRRSKCLELHNISQFFLDFFLKEKNDPLRGALISLDKKYLPLSIINNNHPLIQAALIQNRMNMVTNHPKNVSKNMQKFRIHDEEKRIEIAKIVAKISGLTISTYIKNFEITNRKALLKIASVAIRQNAFAVSEQIENFDILEEEDRVKIAKKIAALNGRALIRNKKKYKISAETWDQKIVKIAEKQMRPSYALIANTERVFCMLGDEIWKQMIDAKYHQYGRFVFDRGLHGEDKEPGFYKSLIKGFDFAKKYLHEELSVQYYKALHKKLCGHFEGEKNSTQVTKKEVGQFRNVLLKPCTLPLNDCDEEFRFYNLHAIIYEKYNHLAAYLPQKKWAKKFEDFLFDYSQEHRDYLLLAKEVFSNLLNEENISEKIKTFKCYKKLKKNRLAEIDIEMNRMDDELKSLCERLQIPKIARVFRSNHSRKIVYYAYSQKNLEKIVEAIFHHYKSKMYDLNVQIKNSNGFLKKEVLKKYKLIEIARLFQLLEWLHPFPDGQGRTDLVLLGKILSEEGFNPAILEEPYFSSYFPLDDWCEYLMEGTEKWKRVAYGLNANKTRD